MSLDHTFSKLTFTIDKIVYYLNVRKLFFKNNKYKIFKKL